MPPCMLNCGPPCCCCAYIMLCARQTGEGVSAEIRFCWRAAAAATAAGGVVAVAHLVHGGLLRVSVHGLLLHGRHGLHLSCARGDAS